MPVFLCILAHFLIPGETLNINKIAGLFLAILAGNTGVSANVPAKKFMMRNPAMEMKKNVASYMSLRRLPRIQKRINELNKLIDEIFSKINKK